MSKTHRVLLLVMCCVLSVGVVACGGTETSTTAGATASVGPQPGAPTTISPSTSTTIVSIVPQARLSHQMVYDSSIGKVIMFGGMAEPLLVGDEQLSDVWAFDSSTNAWMKLEPSGGGPSGRAHHCVACDTSTGKLILFGGVSRFTRPLNDTWAYDPAANVWTKLDPSDRVPSKRSDHSMAYDSITGKVILFGGFGDEFVRDTWAYDSSSNTWTKLWPSGDRPRGRCRHSMVYDPVGHKVILFGGLGGKAGPLSDTWAYDPAADTWTELTPSGDLPPARCGQCMVYDPTSAKVILFGGEIAWVKSSGEVTTVPLDDTWAYDPAANTWTELTPSGDKPLARAYSSLVYDSDMGKAILFGGLYGGTTLNDTWAYDPAANTWTELRAGDPAPNLDARIVDTSGGRPPTDYELKGLVVRMLRQ